MLEKLRKNNKKGFTLVELIVVLVILAILAALLIPTLTGYIDKAKEKQIIAETRQIVMAAQTLVDEEYAKKGVDDATGITFANATGNVASTIYMNDIATLAEIKTLTWAANESDVDAADEVFIKLAEKESKTLPKIGTVVYYAHGLKCTYTESDGSYVVTK
ncbi:MAG: prepilin-type N-terminal cleavage/methylation domain-containing protein [Lachnospiraceae bacterium]|nr:prepilin-type N-terminal cleavage/methylation domain-containing protein [Lachnospiraceae bacterium]